MPLWIAALLGIVEGLTEYLPVSSTGHLILVGHALGLRDESNKTYEIVIQFGAILAVVVYYRSLLWRRLGGLFRKDPDALRLLYALIAAFVPTAVAGVLLRKTIKRLLFGPWSHASLETCLPGPNIDLVPEMARWWDRWLKGADNGVDREPPIVLFVRRPTRPAADLKALNGEWRFEETWPLDRGGELSMRLDEATAPGRGEMPSDALDVRGDVGWTAWISCAGGLPWGQPIDQRPDEAYSLVYDWGPFDHEVEILGHPRLEVTVASSAPVAYLAAKLCDVHPDGTSQLVTRGLLNLTHRDSREHPTPLEPGTPYRVSLELEVASFVFEPGHRIRLDLAGTDWPNAWPPPGPVTLTVERSGSALVLPTVDGPSPVAERPVLPAPSRPQAPDESARGEPLEEITWAFRHDILKRETVAEVRYGGPSDGDDVAPAIEQWYGGTVGVSTEDPGRAWVDAKATYRIRWPQAEILTEARSTIRSDHDAYHVRIEIDTAEDGEPRWSRAWERTIPRHAQ